MSKLSVIASKPASVASREWITASIHDAVCNGQLKPGDITKTMLQGDRTHVGLVALFECKQKDLVYGKRFDAGVKQAARQGGSAEHVWEQEQIQEAWKVIVTELAKEAEERKALASAEAQEDEGPEPADEALASPLRVSQPISPDVKAERDITKTMLQGDRTHVGLVALFECKQKDLVYGKRFDAGVKQGARQGGSAEHVWEQEQIQEAWKVIVTELAREAEERKALASAEAQEDEGPEPADEALASAQEDEGPEPADEALASVRQPPTSHPLHSTGYWRSVANQTVRTYVTLQPEPKTTDGVSSAVAQSSLKDMKGTQGQSCIMTFLDMDCLGESQGPGAQPLLRKKYTADTLVLRKLIQGSKLGRGSQKRENGEATKVIDGDVVVIHDGFGHPGGQKEAKAMFRLSTAKKESDLDSEAKDMMVIYEDGSIRTRKQRVRGNYGCYTSLTMASSVSLSQCLPEKPFEFHPGHSTSNVFQGVKALSPSELWLELAAGQGCAAKACLMERVPYFGFVLSEQHGKKLELLLTEFLLAQMKVEGSSHYRPEAVQEAAEAAETSNTTGQTQKNKKTDESSTQPKKKPRKTKKEETEAQGRKRKLQAPLCPGE
eukprot:s3581_g3.t1